LGAVYWVTPPEGAIASKRVEVLGNFLIEKARSTTIGAWFIVGEDFGRQPLMKLGNRGPRLF